MNRKKSIEANNINKNGVHLFDEILDKEKIAQLHNKIIDLRSFGEDLFLSESEYASQKNHFNTNPSKEVNLLNQFKEELDLIEKNTRIVIVLNELLGPDYEIVIKKLVCGVPNAWLPDWVSKKIDNVNIANLGPYIKKQYRDVTYFRGIDFHQDIIDWPEGRSNLDPSTFFTLYVYLHDVDRYDSPLHILPGSHTLGSTLFPHKLIHKGDDCWSYEDDVGNLKHCYETILTGKAGFVGLWHNCLLHGTQPVNQESEKYRISLRYLIGKSNNNKNRTGVDEINDNIQGILKPLRTRRDLDMDGKVKIRGNSINQGQKGVYKSKSKSTLKTE